MYFSCEKCPDKKALQQSALITFPKSALVTCSKAVLYKHPEGDPLQVAPDLMLLYYWRSIGFKIKVANNEICNK